MAGELANLKTALDAKAGELSDSLDQLECLALIAEWYAARTAVSALASTDVQQYTLAGRSVTRANLPALRDDVDRMWQRIVGILYPGGALVDLRGSVDVGGYA